MTDSWEVGTGQLEMKDLRYDSVHVTLLPSFGSCQLLGHMDNDTVFNNLKYERAGLYL